MGTCECEQFRTVWQSVGDGDHIRKRSGTRQVFNIFARKRIISRQHFCGRRQHAIASLPIFDSMPSQRRPALPPHAQASRDRYLDFALIFLRVRSEVIREQPSELLASCAVVPSSLHCSSAG